VEQSVYQRQASMKPAHFKTLLQSLRFVLNIHEASSSNVTPFKSGRSDPRPIASPRQRRLTDMVPSSPLATTS